MCTYHTYLASIQNCLTYNILLHRTFPRHEFNCFRKNISLIEEKQILYNKEVKKMKWSHFILDNFLLGFKKNQSTCDAMNIQMNTLLFSYSKVDWPKSEIKCNILQKIKFATCYFRNRIKCVFQIQLWNTSKVCVKT